MTDYRTMYDYKFLHAVLLQGRDVVVEIARVVGAEVIGEGGKKSKMPVLFFKDKELPLALNKTNGKTVASMYGKDTSKWVGQKLVLYPTTTTKGKEVVDCIRVKPSVPKEQ